MDYSSLVAAQLARRHSEGFDPAAEDAYYRRSMPTFAPFAPLRSIVPVLMQAIRPVRQRSAPV